MRQMIVSIIIKLNGFFFKEKDSGLLGPYDLTMSKEDDRFVCEAPLISMFTYGFKVGKLVLTLRAWLRRLRPGRPCCGHKPAARYGIAQTSGMHWLQ